MEVICSHFVTKATYNVPKCLLNILYESLAGSMVVVINGQQQTGLLLVITRLNKDA